MKSNQYLFGVALLLLFLVLKLGVGIAIAYTSGPNFSIFPNWLIYLPGILCLLICMYKIIKESIRKSWVILIIAIVIAALELL